MKRILLIFSLFLTMTGSVCTLSAQLQLDWDLVIENVNGSFIGMRLDVENNTDQEWTYTFNSAPATFYSIDGQIHTGMLLPMTLPYSLGAGESDSFEMHYYGYLTPGEHLVQAHLNIAIEDDYLSVGEPEIVVVEEVLPIPSGDGSEPARVPIDFYWRNSLYQCIYTPADYGYQPGTLIGFSIYNQFDDYPYNNFIAQQIQMHMGNTTLSDLSEGWSPINDILPQFDGLMDFPAGNNEIHFELMFPINLSGYNNVRMMMFRPIHSAYQYTSDPFLADECAPTMALQYYSDAIIIDPNNPPELMESHFCERKPLTTFYIIPNGDPVSVEEEIVPSPIVGIHAQPNPFSGGCELKLTKPLQSLGTLKVYDIKGRMIRKLEPSCSDTYFWDGKDYRGKDCPTGLYIYKADIGAGGIAGRMIKL
ncbi:MAG: hypothetical protein PHY21_02740 [Candidatus Cloacimonetes bacterium]|nr:hypothetical protein [Candidatus Cloacimonadota bacterium]